MARSLRRPGTILRTALALVATAGAVVYLQVHDAQRAEQRTTQRAQVAELAADVAAYQQAHRGASPKLGSAAVPRTLGDLKIRPATSRHIAGTDPLERRDYVAYVETGRHATLLSVSFDQRSESSAAGSSSDRRVSRHTWHVCRFDVSAGTVSEVPCTTRTDRVAAPRR